MGCGGQLLSQCVTSQLGLCLLAWKKGSPKPPWIIVTLQRSKYLQWLPSAPSMKSNIFSLAIMASLLSLFDPTVLAFLLGSSDLLPVLPPRGLLSYSKHHSTACCFPTRLYTEYRQRLNSHCFQGPNKVHVTGAQYTVIEYMEGEM